jgi:hypothetical protein
MSKNLPVRSSTREIQNRHLRRYASGKITLVNPRVNKTSKPATTNQYEQQQRIDAVNKSIREAKPTPKPFQPRIKLRWQEVMKKDDGTARPVSSPKLYDPSQALEELDFLPTRNEEEFDIEYIDKPLKELNEKIKKGEITEEEAKEAYKEIIEEANGVLESDEMQPELTLIYGNPNNKDEDRGYLGTYTAYNIDLEDIDTRYVKLSSWRGYYDVVIPQNSKWELLHEDIALAMSEDGNNLHTFSEELYTELDNKGIEYATAVIPTGNFAANITYLVEKGKSKEVEKIIEKLKKQYRKPEDFEKETNPLYEGVKEAKQKGLNAEDIKKSLKDKTTTETKKILEKAIKEVFPK